MLFYYCLVAKTNYRVNPTPTVKRLFRTAPDNPIDTRTSSISSNTPFLMLEVTHSTLNGNDSIFYFSPWSFTHTDTLYTIQAAFLDRPNTQNSATVVTVLQDSV